MERIPSQSDIEREDNAVARHAGLMETLAAWTTTNFEDRPTAPLSLDQVVDIVMKDRDALRGVRGYLEMSCRANKRDEEMADVYLKDLLWAIAERVVK